MYRVPEIERHIIMQTDVICDVYSGEEHTSMFGTYCEGDMESDTHTDDITVRLSDLPPGGQVIVSIPCCPECSDPRREIYNSELGTLTIIGWESTCECGFSWSNWEEEIYG